MKNRSTMEDQEVKENIQGNSVGCYNIRFLPKYKYYP